MPEGVSSQKMADTNAPDDDGKNLPKRVSRFAARDLTRPPNRVSRFAGKELVTGPPDISKPTLTQTHNLTAQDFETGPPDIGLSTLTVLEESDLKSSNKVTKWPDGLTDRETSERLRGFMVAVANGQRNIAEDRQYRTLRSLIMRHKDLARVAPRLLATHASLDSLDTYLKTLPRPARLIEVNADFQPLFDYFDDSVIRDPETDTDSSTWTGQKSRPQLAEIVRVKSGNALKVVERLVEDYEARHHNGGPTDPDEDDALSELKEFRDALNDLIEALDAEQPFGEKLEAVQSLGERAKAKLIEHLSNDAGTFLSLTSMITYSSAVAACAWAIGADSVAAFGTTGAAYVALKLGSPRSPIE